MVTLQSGSRDERCRSPHFPSAPQSTDNTTHIHSKMFLPPAKLPGSMVNLPGHPVKLMINISHHKLQNNCAGQHTEAQKVLEFTLVPRCELYFRLQSEAWLAFLPPAMSVGHSYGAFAGMAVLQPSVGQGYLLQRHFPG